MPLISHIVRSLRRRKILRKLLGFGLGVGLLSGLATVSEHMFGPWLSAPEAQASALVTGPVIHVRDGDTIELAGHAIRLATLDCAERNTQAGKRATARMRELIRDGSVQCELSGRMSYDRHIGECRNDRFGNLSAVLIREGFCARWH